MARSTVAEELELPLEEPAGAAPGQERLRRLYQIREFGILAAAIGLFVALSIARPETFFTEDNILRVAMQISLLTILATGMTFLFIAGEIDLSIGAMYGLLALTISKMLFDWQWPPWVAMPAVIAIGAGIGSVNGFLTTRFRIPSFIVTLGMLGILRGIALVWIRTPPIGRSPQFDQVTAGRLFGEIPVQILWMLGVVLIASFVLSRTKFGYHVYATGDNELAARNAGIDTRRVKLLCFVIVGALAGLAASILIGWVHGVSRGYGPGYELDVIAAVVIGGTSLFGGYGTIVGTFLGAALLTIVRNGLVQLGGEGRLQEAFLGAIIILAVLIHTHVGRRR